MDADFVQASFGQLSLKYLSGFLRCCACQNSSLHQRRLVALAAHLFLRPGELKAIQKDDVDLDHGISHVHQATNWRKRTTKGTKVGQARRLVIERNLLPLLRVLHDGADGEGLVVRMPSDLARTFRSALLRAGVDRAELHEATPTRQAMTFRDLRATGTTLQAVRGDEPLHITQRAGHTTFGTRLISVRTAEELREGFARASPTSLQKLLERPNAHSKRTQTITAPATLRGESRIWRKRTGIEPARDSGTAPHRF